MLGPCHCFFFFFFFSVVFFCHQWSGSYHPFSFPDSFRFTPGIFTPGSTLPLQLINLITNLSDCPDS